MARVLHEPTYKRFLNRSYVTGFAVAVRFEKH